MNLKTFRFLLMSLLLFAATIPALATSITVASTNIPNWTFAGTSASIRIFPNATFVTSTGQTIVGGTAAGFYKTVTCTVATTTVSCPSFTIDSTEDSSLATVRYTAQIYDELNKPRANYMNAFRVPTSLGVNVTWEQLRVYNSAGSPTLPITYYTAAQTDQAIQLALADSAVPPVQSLTDAATITWNAANGRAATVTIAGNRTVAAPSGLVAGGTYSLSVTQGTGGNRTLSWNSAFKWPSATPPTLSTSAGKTDVVNCVSFDGTNLYCNALNDLSAAIAGRTAPLDLVSVGTKTAAYGFSKLRAAYSGSAVRVINTTTSTQTDVGFDSGGNFNSTAAAALKTGSQVLEIVKYYDQSGNGLDLTAVSARHILDLTGYRVGARTGTAGSLSNGYTSSGTTSLTTPHFFFVSEFYTYGQSVLFDTGGGNQMQTRNEGGTAILPSITKRHYINNGTGITSTESVSYGSPASDGIRQLTSIFQTGNDRMRRDGIELTVGANAGDTARTGSTLTLGDFAGGGGLGWSGRFYEAIILDGTPTSGEITAVENNQRSYHQDGKVAMLLGDSLAYGTSTANIYTDGPAARLKSILPSGWDTVNRGYAGSTIPEITARFTNEIAPNIRTTATRNVVLISLGTNDAVAGHSAATIASDMTALITAIHAYSPSIDVYILSIPKQNAWPSSWATMQAANALYAANYASYGAAGFIDSRANTHIGDSASTTDATYYVGDDVHLTAAGYDERMSYVSAVINP